MSETPEQQIERLFSEIAACKLCRGTLRVRVKHGTVYITDSDDEIERAYHNESCSNCADRLAAALKREREHAQAEIERLTKERDELAARIERQTLRIAQYATENIALRDQEPGTDLE